jgi:hypothetical protein
LAQYLIQVVFRKSGEGPAKRWTVKNAENRSPHRLPHIFLPNKNSANGCEGNMAVREIGPIFDSGGLQEIGGRAGKKMGGKKVQKTEVPIFYRTFFCRIKSERMVVNVTSL